MCHGERFDANYPHLKGHFCQLIDNQVKSTQTLIDDFSLVNKFPQIAVGVDMLDTGIDVPECVNLVFFKRVRSKTKFWQMIGRGIRLCPNLFGPAQDKEFFYIFDFCDNLAFFDSNPEGYEATVSESVKTQIFRLRLALTDLLNRHHQGAEPLIQLRNEVLDTLHGLVTSMNIDSFLVRPHRRQVEKFSRREAWQELTPSDFSDISNHLVHLPTPDEDE